MQELDNFMRKLHLDRLSRAVFPLVLQGYNAGQIAAQVNRKLSTIYKNPGWSERRSLIAEFMAWRDALHEQPNHETRRTHADHH